MLRHLAILLAASKCSTLAQRVPKPNCLWPVKAHWNLFRSKKTGKCWRRAYGVVSLLVWSLNNETSEELAETALVSLEIDSICSCTPCTLCCTWMYECRGRMRPPGMVEGRATQEQLPGCAGAAAFSSILIYIKAPRHHPFDRVPQRSLTLYTREYRRNVQGNTRHFCYHRPARQAW